MWPSGPVVAPADIRSTPWNSGRLGKPSLEGVLERAVVTDESHWIIDRHRSFGRARCSVGLGKVDLKSREHVNEVTGCPKDQLKDGFPDGIHRR